MCVCVCMCVCVSVHACVHVHTWNVCMCGVCLSLQMLHISLIFSHECNSWCGLSPTTRTTTICGVRREALICSANMLLCRHSMSVKVVAQGYLWPKWDRTAMTEGARSLPQALLTLALMLTLDHFLLWVLFTGTSNDCVYTQCKIQSD